MLLNDIDRKIRRAFSNSAMQYESFSSLQKEIGRELVKKISDCEKGERILDIGAGTGRLANRISFLFPDALVCAMDFAPGMLKVAKEKYETLKILQAQAAALPFQPRTFDIVVSNLMYQWIEDLDKSFEQVHAVLKNQGVFCFTMFGQQTLKELFEALEATAGKTAGGLRFRRLADGLTVHRSLEDRGFQIIDENCEIIKTHFNDLFDLVSWLKSTGANTGRQSFFVGKDHLQRANEYYKNHFQDPWGVTASFEVLWLKGIKNE